MSSYALTDATDGTEAGAVAELSAAALATDTLDEVGVVALPDGFKLHDLDGFAEHPRRAKASVTVVDLTSFTRYLRRFGLTAADVAPGDSPDVVVFADPQAGRFRAVLDYHDAEGPEHGDHTCTLQLKASDEFQAWRKNAGRKMGQIELAEFFEQRIEDIAEPRGAALLEAVQHVQAVRNVEFASKVNLDNGDLVFAFSSDTKGKGEVTMPERFALGVRLFEGVPAYRIDARLRYRVSDEGELSLWYQLVNLDAVELAAGTEMLAEVEAVVGEANVFVGTQSR